MIRGSGTWHSRGIALAVWVVSCAAITLWCDAAAASELSKRMYSRGLVEFHAGRLQEALQYFDRAVAADDYDALALYYRAVTRSRLNDRDGSIADLQQTLKVKPDLLDAALDLGVALVEAGRFEEAIAPLQQARNQADLDAQASLYLGIAYLRLENYGQARTYFEHVRNKSTDLEPTARYYLGVLDYKLARFQSATEHFNYAMLARPDSRVAEESKSFLARVEQAKKASWEVFGAVGFQYDSNVILAPNNDLASSAESQIGVSSQSDGRVTLNAGGNYLLARSDWGRIVVGYDFYQSLHFELHQFNLQDHRANVTFSASTGPFQWGIIGRYDYFLLETDDFLREGTISPYIGLPEGDIGYSEIAFQFRRHDFLKPEFQIRDSSNYGPSLTQIFFLQKRHDRYLSLGYMFDREDTAGPGPDRRVDQSTPFMPASGSDPRQFAYDGHQLSIGLGWTLPFEIASEISYIYRYEDYASVPSHDRRDTEHHVILVARRPITEHLSVSGGYFAQINDSHQSQDDPEHIRPNLYNYERHIASLTLEVRF